MVFDPNNNIVIKQATLVRDSLLVVDVPGPQPAWTEFALTQNYPNPFNPTTVVSYQLPVASDVKLAVYDLLGREVMVVVDERKAAGRHEVRLDARPGGQGAGLSSGVYIYRLTAGQYVESRKMVLMK